jgi:hypothetical protein
MQVGQRSVGTLDRPRLLMKAFLLDQDVATTPPSVGAPLYGARAEFCAASIKQW